MMLNIKKLLNKKESRFLFESLPQVWNIKPWLGVVDPEGSLIVDYPKIEGQRTIKNYFRIHDSIDQNSYQEVDSYIYSPLVIGDTCIGSLVSKSNGVETEFLRPLLELLNTLLTKQINAKIEKKEILRETLDTYKEINLLYNIGESIGSCLDVEQLAKTILLESIKIIRSENCSLMLINTETSMLEIKAAAGSYDSNRVDLGLGRGIAGIVAQEAKYIISNDTLGDHRFIPGNNNIRSLLCVPLKTRHKILGVINLSNKLDGKMFTARDAKLLYAMASQAANFIENAILYEQKLAEDRLKSKLERYLSPNVVKSLTENNQELTLGGIKKKVAVLFADIRDFTSISEEMAPEELVKFLNEYFTHMVDIIFKYGGTVDKFVGDEIMAVFGAPITQSDDEIRAIMVAVEMQKKMKDLQNGWQEENRQLFSIGIGINSGEVIAGNIGSKKHMDYTVIGDVVNTAKRLESQASGGKILVSRTIQEITEKLYKFNDVGKILVKGKKKPVETFEIIY